MSDLASQIADIERELLALTANQPPNPAQITIFKKTYTSNVNFETKTIYFTDGNPRWINVYTSVWGVYLLYEVDQLKIRVVDAGTVFTIVSLGDFTIG